jgi:hypothetical protein
MSGAFGPIIGDAAAAFALISPIGQRSIGTLLPDVAVEEIHHDESEITQHPVETGSPVSDHVYDQPATVEIRWFWGDSAAQAEGFSQVVYQELLALKASHTVFNVSTGKRQYTNMLMRTLLVKTDPETEFTLAVTAICQNLIFATLQTAAGSNSPNTNGSSAVGNVSDPPGTGGIGSDTAAAAHAAAAGAPVDSQGFVSFPNDIAPGGSIALSPVVASSWGQVSQSIGVAQ